MRGRFTLLLKDVEQPRTMDFSFEIDAKAVSEEGQFEGYASVFGVTDQGGDNVQPGAFIEGIAKAATDRRLIPMLWQHDRAQPIGKWLDMSEDAKGLWVKGRLLKDAVPQAATAYALLKEGAIGGLSIGYRIAAGGAIEDPKRRGVFLLKKLDLIEVSLVTLPMLIQAKISAVKSLLEAGQLPTVRQFEEFLRDAGVPRVKATAIASAAAPHLRGDPEQKAEGAAALAVSLGSRLASFNFGSDQNA